MLKHDVLSVVEEEQTVIAARCIQCHTESTHNESRVCEECKAQDDTFYHGQKNELRSQICAMIHTLRKLGYVNVVLTSHEVKRLHEIEEGTETIWHSKKSLENIRNGLYGELMVNIERLKCK